MEAIEYVRRPELTVQDAQAVVFPFELPRNGTSVVYEASRVVASGQSRCFGLQGYNSGAAQFVLVFDSATLPANGAIPKIVIAVGAASNFSAYFGSSGRWFWQGIYLANSSTGPTLTIGAADCFFDAQYI